MRKLALLALTSVTLTGCGTSDSGSSALAGFEGSPCKLDSEVGLAAIQPSDYEGMQCIVWEPVGENLSVALLNFSAACGVPWKGEARLDDPTSAELRVYNPSDGVGGCDCLYDWTFEVEGLAADEDVALTVTLDQGPVVGDPDSEEVTLPLGSTPSGALCRYASYWLMEQYASNLGRCGEELMPCSCFDATPMCAADLTCAPGADASSEVCHASCTADADCGTARSCQDGLCRPASPW